MSRGEPAMVEVLVMMRSGGDLAQLGVWDYFGMGMGLFFGLELRCYCSRINVSGLCRHAVDCSSTGACFEKWVARLVMLDPKKHERSVLLVEITNRVNACLNLHNLLSFLVCCR